jgi:hypothetical protein
MLVLAIQEGQKDAKVNDQWQKKLVQQIHKLKKIVNVLNNLLPQELEAIY